MGEQNLSVFRRSHRHRYDELESIALMGLIKLFQYVWAFPATLLGLVLVPFAIMQGGEARIVEGVLEVHGGIVTRLLRRGLPWVGSGAAMTLGHVVLGCDRNCLQQSRSHERIHVRQFERWGPIMIPAYLLASLYVYLRGHNPYLDNPFEREAFENETLD
jgi:hypothetical protein